MVQTTDDLDPPREDELQDELRALVDGLREDVQALRDEVQALGERLQTAQTRF
jgi:outer membrane murein-binding lipoprotein Lpp